jgi:hypothetical protein
MESPQFQYSEQLEVLIDMGFEKEATMNVLSHFKGDISKVLNKLKPTSEKEYNYEENTREINIPSGLSNIGNSTLFISMLHQLIPTNILYATII